MNRRQKFEEEKIGKRNIKRREDEIEKEKEKKREAYLKQKEEEIRNRKIDYKKKREEEKKENKEDDNEYEEIEEEEERSNKKEEKNRIMEKEKYDKHIEKNYLGHKGITKRTIGIGRLNVKVYENDEDDSEFDYVVKKEKKEKREYKNIETIKNKNTEDKNMKNNEIKSINLNNNNSKYNNTEGKDSIVFNIDGKKFLVKVSYNYSNSSGEGETINIKFSTTSHGSKIVHWGLYKTNSPKIWVLPPKSSYPNFTKEVNNKALETKFPNSQVNGQRIISFALPRKLDGEYIGGINFSIFDPIKNLWYNNFKKNFNLKFN